MIKAEWKAHYIKNNAVIEKRQFLKETSVTLLTALLTANKKIDVDDMYDVIKYSEDLFDIIEDKCKKLE